MSVFRCMYSLYGSYRLKTVLVCDGREDCAGSRVW